MEKLLIFLVLIGISKLVDLVKNSGAGNGQPGGAAGRRVPAAGDVPAEQGRPGGLRGILEELLRVPAEDSGASSSGQSLPAASAKAQKPRENARPQRPRPADRSGQSSGERSGGVRPKAAKGGKRSGSGSGSGSGLSASTATGEGVARHVEQAISAHVRQHVGSAISESVRRDIGEHVESTFGQDAAGGAAMAGQTGGAAGIRRILKSPGGVQQAMLVSEILNRPRIFRR